MRLVQLTASLGIHRLGGPQPRHRTLQLTHSNVIVLSSTSCYSYLIYFQSSSYTSLPSVSSASMESNFQTLDGEFEYVFKCPVEIHEFRFRLLDLPPELWIRICEFAVMKPYEIDTTRAKKPKHQMQVVRQPAISFTCRLLRQEALPLFYKSNNFIAYHWAGVACIRKWLLTIGHANLRNLGTLTFHCVRLSCRRVASI